METKIELDVVTNQLQSALDELKRKRLDRNLIHDYITEALSRVKKLNEPAVSNNEALELSDGVAFANYIEEKWKQYRTITNNEDAWCFKQWLVGK